jgi:hypothetical protein
VLFALTFITSIAGLLLYDPVLNDADYILGDGADTRVQLGALCEIFLAITNNELDETRGTSTARPGRERDCDSATELRARPDRGGRDSLRCAWNGPTRDAAAQPHGP